jgi:hypothetical protein
MGVAGRNTQWIFSNMVLDFREEFSLGIIRLEVPYALYLRLEQ